MNIRRALFFGLGMLSLGTGLVGLVLPVLPTTIFVIIAAACFARSSERLERRLLEDPRFGPTIRAWRETGAIPRRGKILAMVGMAIGYAMFWFSVRPGPWLGLGVAVFFLACAGYVLSRPTAPVDPEF